MKGNGLGLPCELRGRRTCQERRSKKGMTRPLMRTLAVCLAAAALLLLTVASEAIAQNSSGDKLIALIVREQAKNVKKSTGVDSYNCFTDDDSARFRESGRVGKIVEGLRADTQFKELVTAIREIPEPVRAELLVRARRTAQPTFAMVGFVDSSGKSQTEAGRSAQLEIARAICDTLRLLIAGGK